MEKCRINEQTITVEHLIEVYEKNGVLERLHKRLEQNHKTEKKLLQPTFEELVSGKSIAEIEKDRKDTLKREWEKRRREAVLYTKGE